MTTPPAAPATPKLPTIAASPTGTEYRVLAATHQEHEWLDCGTVIARNADHAITKYVEKNGAGTIGKFRAVPARSWGDEPVTVTVETKTTIRLG